MLCVWMERAHMFETFKFYRGGAVHGAFNLLVSHFYFPFTIFPFQTQFFWALSISLSLSIIFIRLRPNLYLGSFRS